MPEEGNKEFNPEESIDELGSYIEKQEKEKKQKDRRIEKVFSKIDKHLENIKNMSNPEKDMEEKITWPEMNEALLVISDDGKPIIKAESLIKIAKNLSTGGENRITEANLEHVLRRVDDGYYSGEFGEEEVSIVGGVIDKKLTETKKITQTKEILKGMKSPDLGKEENLPKFFKIRVDQERELDMILKKDEKELTDLDKIRVNQLVESLYKQPLSEMDLSFFGGSSEKPPKVEEVGVETYKEWFENKIHALIEEYPDQNFETNWTLTYTIQQGVNNLWPKEGQDEFEYKVKGTNGQEIIRKDSYTRLRKELALKLESYRAVHNFIYLYRRVPGVAEAIGPAGLLEAKYLQCLLRENGKDNHGRNYSVADALREFYQLGGIHRLEADKGKRKEIIKEMIEKQDKSWQGRVAGALYSAFQGGGRDGHLVLNEGGDFFTGRLYNMPDWVKTLWKDKWKRSDWPGLYKALDLKVDDFWDDALKVTVEVTNEEITDYFVKNRNLFKKGAPLFKKGATLESQKEQIRTILESQKKKIKTKLFLEKMKIYKEDIDKAKVFRLENARFEKIDLVGNLNITSDHLKHIILSLEEADVIRKMILNPKGLVDNPGFGHINAMWEKFKHIKAKDRSEWFAPLIKELIWFFRDKVAPWSDSLPASMRNCPAKEVFPYFTPMTDEQLTNVVWALTPPLHKEDANKVLNEAIGPKGTRTFVRAARIGVGAVGSMIIEGIKAALGLK